MLVEDSQSADVKPAQIRVISPVLAPQNNQNVPDKINPAILAVNNGNTAVQDEEKKTTDPASLVEEGIQESE